MEIFRKSRRRAERGITVITQPPQAVQTHTTPKTFDEVYRSSHAVRATVDFLGRQCGRYEAEVVLRSAPGIEQVQPPKDKLTELLRAPSPDLSRYELIRGWISSLALAGNSYSVLIREGDVIRYIVPVRSSIVSLQGPADGDEVDGYILNLPSGPETVPRQDMLHMKLYNPGDPRVGVSPLESLRHLLSEDDAASRDRQRFWLNASRPFGVIERPLDAPSWDDDTRKRFRTDWQNAMTGEHSFLAAVLEESMKWSATERISPVDAAFVEGRTQILSAVASALGVPPQLVGASTENVRAASALVAFTLSPWIEMIEGAINAQLTPQIYGDQSIYGRIFVRLVQNPTIQDASADLTTAVRGGWLAPNEARAVVGLPKIDGGDTLAPAAPAPTQGAPA